MTLHLPIKDNSFSYSRASNCLFGINAQLFEASSDFPPWGGFSRWGSRSHLWVMGSGSAVRVLSSLGSLATGEPSCCLCSVAVALTESAGACERLCGFCPHVGISRSWPRSAVAFGFKVSIVQQPSFSSFRTVHLVDSWERRRLELWNVLGILFKFGQPTGYPQTPWSVPSASPELVPPSCAVLHMPLSHKKDSSEWLARLCLGKRSSHPSCCFGLTLHPHPASSTHTSFDPERKEGEVLGIISLQPTLPFWIPLCPCPRRHSTFSLMKWLSLLHMPSSPYLCSRENSTFSCPSFAFGMWMELLELRSPFSFSIKPDIQDSLSSS